jgi:chromosome segregation ATPase
MTDEELVKRLRDDVNGEHDMTPHGADCLQAADRIEALTAERDDYAFKLSDANNTYSEMHVELEALTEQLEAARADAKKAEGYAEELEKEIELNEQEACMLENDLIKADKEIDNLKVKLAKAVEGLRQIAEQTKGVTPEPDNLQIAIGSIHSYARALLAEIEGEKG